MMVPPPLQVKGLTRSFGEFQAIKPTSFELNAGEVVIISGPNGAGKSTLLYCLSGLLRPSTGSVLVEGFDFYAQEIEAKRRLAFVPDVPRFYQELTCWEHMYFISLAHQVKEGWEERSEAILKEFELFESRNLFPHTLSRGMRLKMGIALSLIRPFKVLIMDEPTSALDAAGVDLFVQKILAQRDSGKAVLLSSHDQRLILGTGAINWQMDHGTLKVV